MKLGLAIGTCFSVLFLFSVSVWGQQLTEKKILDPKGAITLSWLSTADSITMELQAKTPGYVGFGISPNGVMKDAYIVIGWLKDGKAELHHGKSLGHEIPTWSAPPKDYALLSSSKNGNLTTIRFQRKLTAENAGDYPITPGEMTFIYAHHPIIPVDRNGIEYHGLDNRGAVKLALIRA